MFVHLDDKNEEVWKAIADVLKKAVRIDREKFVDVA
jgi:hypothetical protein